MKQESPVLQGGEKVKDTVEYKLMPEFNENLRPRPPDPYEGRVIDKYTLISKLGTGGMGLVYRAEQLRIKRQVAIKLLSAKLIHDQVNVKRIEREAAAMGNLRHPNIATFHDFGISDGQPYLVMELIAGRSLGDLLDEQTRLEPERVITIAAQVADAMAYAHRQGLIHRDLKPDNIMLDNEHTNDFAKVLDFGIAKTAEDLSLTKSGVLIGSPLYMSPEQCRGGKLDLRSDIYSLGVIIYEALTGLVPCKGETLIETLSRKTMEQAPPFPPEFSEWKDLERLTLACLATEPEGRPQSMAIVRDELFGLLNPGAISMSMSSLQRSRHLGASETNPAMTSPTQNQSQALGQSQSHGQNQSLSRSRPASSESGLGRSTQSQSRIGARRPARSTQSQTRSNTGRLTQSQTQSQLHGHPPVLDETGQLYTPVISSKQMIIIGTTIGAFYLMSVVAGAALIGFSEGNGLKTLLGGTGSQASSGTGGANRNNGSSTSTSGTGSSTDSSAANGPGTASGTNGVDLPGGQNRSGQASTAQNQSSTGHNTTPPSTKSSTATKPEIKPVKTAEAKTTKHARITQPEQAHRHHDTEPVHTYRYGSTTANNPNQNIPNYNAKYSSQNSAGGPSPYTDYADPNNDSAASQFQALKRNVRINRQTVRINQDRLIQERLKQTLEAVTEDRAATAAARARAEGNAANERRFNNIDVNRRQYGGGSQWGTDTGSKYYGNGNF